MFIHQIFYKKAFFVFLVLKLIQYNMSFYWIIRDFLKKIWRTENNDNFFFERSFSHSLAYHVIYNLIFLTLNYCYRTNKWTDEFRFKSFLRCDDLHCFQILLIVHIYPSPLSVATVARRRSLYFTRPLYHTFFIIKIKYLLHFCFTKNQGHVFNRWIFCN